MRDDRTILLVVRAGALRRRLSTRLTFDDGFAVHQAATLREAANRLGQADVQYDAIVLDTSLPDGSGRAFCARLRDQGVKLPVIVVAGTAGAEDAVGALRDGADDFLADPGRIAELGARLRAHMRSAGARDDLPFAIGPFTLIPAGRLLLDPSTGRRVQLTGREAAILKRLAQAKGAAVPAEGLVAAGWGHTTTGRRSGLETHIWRLRQKIEADPAAPRLIVTTRSGYRLPR